jgi:ribosomal protein S18 acetylase RimI-like enzyme
MYQKDEWLTLQLDRPVFRLSDSGLNENQLPQKCFCYAKVSTHNSKLRKKLEKAGFVHQETSWIYEKKGVRSASPAWPVRSAKPEDEAVVCALAVKAFHASRFHMDPFVGPDLGGKIKSDWAKNFFFGLRGNRLLVVEEKQKPSGFILLIEGLERTVIDLVCVDPEKQGKGLGKALLQAAETPEKWIQAGTQEINHASRRLYEGLGYSVRETCWVLHRHK